MEEHRDDHLLQGLFRHGLDLLLQHPLYLLVEGLDAVVCVNEVPKAGGEFAGRQCVPRLLRPDRLLLALRLPFGGEGRSRIYGNAA